MVICCASPSGLKELEVDMSGVKVSSFFLLFVLVKVIFSDA